MTISSIMREKGSSESKTVSNIQEWLQYQRLQNLYSTNSTSVSPICTFSLAGSKIVYTPIHGTNREKYFIHII